MAVQNYYVPITLKIDLSSFPFQLEATSSSLSVSSPRSEVYPQWSMTEQGADTADVADNLKVSNLFQTYFTCLGGRSLRYIAHLLRLAD